MILDRPRRVISNRHPSAPIVPPAYPTVRPPAPGRRNTTPGAIILLALALTVALLAAGVRATRAAAPPTPSDLAAAEDARVADLSQGVEPKAIPLQAFRVVAPDTGFGSVLLPGRADPYGLPELRDRFPESFDVMAPGTWLLKDDLIVGEGARLVISSRDVRELRLLSDATRFVAVSGWHGTIDLLGFPGRRLVVRSWNPQLAAPDAELADGRAWLNARGGRMNIWWSDLAYVGFATGMFSGVSWDGRDGRGGGGNIVGSRFGHNYYGVYTYETDGMRWIGNQFLANLGYGFDPHDGSDRFLVLFNAAIGNGDHGFIFSRGCRFNVLRFNLSAGNGRSGFVIDDGPLLGADGQPRNRPPLPSDDNVVANNVAWGNQAGVVLNGGTRNRIEGNRLVANRTGVRVRDAATGNEIVGNAILGSAQVGVSLGGGSADNRVAGNLIDGAPTGLSVSEAPGNVLARNTLRAIANRAVALAGTVDGTGIVGNAIPLTEANAIAAKQGATLDAVRVEGNRFAAADDGSALDRARRQLGSPVAKWLIWSAILLSPLALLPLLERARSVRTPRTAAEARG